MQRWIVIALVGAILVGLGGGFALWNYRQNRPDRVWVRQPLNPELPVADRDRLAAEVKAKILEGTAIPDMVRDVGLAVKLDLPSDAAAETEARNRLFVEIGEFEGPSGTIPLLNVGFTCQRKTHNAMADASMRVMKDVWKMLGIKEPEAPAF